MKIMVVGGGGREHTIIKKLKEKGILFCAASGRQYQSIANMFEPVKDDIVFLAENGAHIRYQDKDIALVMMEREHIEDIVHTIRKENKNGDYIVSTNDGSIMDTKNQEFIDLININTSCAYITIKE